MGKAWMKALFADLAPKSDRDSGYAVDSGDHAAATRWNRQRTTSSPPKPGHHEDYDIAAHARSSLQINNNNTLYQEQAHRNKRVSPSNAPHQASQGGWQQQHHHQVQPRQEDHGQPSSNSSRQPVNLPPPPLGPRPALFPQEVSYHAEDNISPISRTKAAGTTGPGGFFDPRHALLDAQRQYHSAPNYAHHVPSMTPPRSNGRNPPTFPTPNSVSPSRQHTSSNPTRPAYLATPPPRVPHRPNSDPQTTSPQKNGKSPAVSRTTSDEGAIAKPNQCHGTTGAGRRCTRIVKTKAAATKPKVAASKEVGAPSVDYRMNHNALKQLDRRLSVRRRVKHRLNRSPQRRGRVIEIDSESEDDDDFETARISPVKTITASSSDEDNLLEELPVFCFQHVKQTLEQRGTFINAKSVDFQDWIPAFLPQETQLQLRHEMAKSKPEERRGYIYVHEFPFSTGNTEQTTFIKLGRSVRPVARLSEWRSQCRSRQPVVRDIFPLHPTHPLHPDHTSHSMINAYRASPSHQHGRLLFAEQGAKYHQRWERLCLIELAGRAAVQAQNRQDDEIARQACVDCGKIHVELFLVDKGSYERDIREMVLRWQRFVETVL